MFTETNNEMEYWNDGMMGCLHYSSNIPLFHHSKFLLDHKSVKIH